MVFKMPEPKSKGSKMTVEQFLEKSKMLCQKSALYEKRKNSFEEKLNEFLINYEKSNTNLANKLIQIMELELKQKSIENDNVVIQSMTEAWEIEKLRSSQKLKKMSKRLNINTNATKKAFENVSMELKQKDKMTLYNTTMKLFLLKEAFNIQKLDEQNNLVFGRLEKGLHNFEFNPNLNAAANSDRFWAEYRKTIDRTEFDGLVKALTSTSTAV